MLQVFRDAIVPMCRHCNEMTLISDDRFVDLFDVYNKKIGKKFQSNSWVFLPDIYPPVEYLTRSRLECAILCQSYPACGGFW